MALFGCIHECIYIIRTGTAKRYNNGINIHNIILYVFVYVQMCPMHKDEAIGHSGTLELQCVQGHIPRPRLVWST